MRPTAIAAITTATAIAFVFVGRWGCVRIGGFNTVASVVGAMMFIHGCLPRGMADDA